MNDKRVKNISAGYIEFPNCVACSESHEDKCSKWFTPQQLIDAYDLGGAEMLKHLSRVCNAHAPDGHSETDDAVICVIDSIYENMERFYSIKSAIGSNYNEKQEDKLNV